MSPRPLSAAALAISLHCALPIFAQAPAPTSNAAVRVTVSLDAAGRLEQESHLTKDDAVVNKIVYKYDAAGKQVGYSVFDAAGKLVSGSTSPAPSASAKPRSALGR